MATDQLPAPDLRGIDASTLDELRHFIARGFVKRDTVFVSVDDLPKIIERAIAADRARAVPVVSRAFTNELGNAIRITIEGPTSVSENILTPVEVEELRAALNTRPPAPEQPADSFVLQLLVAAGHVSQSKIDEAKAIAAKTLPADLSGQAATAAGEREAFEAWLGRESFTERSDSGKYVSAHVDAMWSAWQARASLSTPASGEGWMPIETAPMDGTPILAFVYGEVHAMRWIEGEGFALWDYCEELLSDADPNPEQPEHWMKMPLPPAPTSPTEPAAEGEA